MTAPLLREAADRLERSLALQIGATPVFKCGGCYGRSKTAHWSAIVHTLDCLISRLRAEADRMEREGLVLVPAEPTEAMLRAAHQSTSFRLDLPGNGLDQALAKHGVRYRAMLSAHKREG